MQDCRFYANKNERKKMALNSSLWNEGYITDEEYIDCYTVELSPLMLNFSCTLAGINVGLSDRVGVNDGFSYLELGFGRGTSINIHAATFDGNFVGTDFNAAHTLIARTNAINGNVKHYEDSFSELLTRFADEKPQFDYIVFHGVFSWIPRAAQDSIIEIIRRHLKPGGIVYNSYNCYPGWAPKAPSRHLFSLFHSHTAGNLNDRIDKLVTFFEDFLKTDSLYTKTTPQNSQLLKELKSFIPLKRSYIAHEYLNGTWDIFYFTDMVKRMSEAKCNFACSGKVLEHYEDLHISPEGIAFLNTIEDKIFREQLKDYYMCKQFRVDIYTKGHINLTRNEATEKVLNTEFVLTNTLDAFQATIKLTRGEGTLTRDIYDKILEVLNNNNAQPKTAREIVETTKIPFAKVLNSLCILMSQGMAMPTQIITSKVKEQSDNFNAALFERQSKQASSLYVASPLIGCAINIGETEQIMIKAMLEPSKKNKSAKELAKYVWEIYKSQNRQHLKDGKVITSDKENLSITEDIAKTFLKDKVEIYKRLGIM